jgi:MFS-type transporter involved in bile tolerance (Atg22 family)
MSKILLMILLIVTTIVLMPVATIWSLNTLFSLNIPTSFDTWCAALILGGVVGGSTGLSFSNRK